jgi:hypothetical protein
MLQVLKYDLSLIVQKRHGLCKRVKKKKRTHEGPSMKKEKNASTSRLMYRKNDEKRER